jgi:hypothetical protein
MCGSKAGHLLLMALMGIALFASVGNSQLSTINQGDIATVKAYADAFNQSRNYVTPFGPAEQYCWTSGTFLAYHPCNDYQTCTGTANLVCTVSGQGGCMLDVLATHILAYKNGVDRLDAAYSSFMIGYSSFSTSNIAGSLSQMDSAFDAMKSAADEVSQSKLRLPDQIPCPCTNASNCCLGRCPEARFNYSAIAAGKARISEIRLKSCSDGTPGGQCSASKPQECVLGQLANNANRCGCPAGMRPAADGKACEFIPCMDNGVIVPAATCSPRTVGKKCENGSLIDKPSECGCPAGQFLSGNICLCPTINSQACNITNVTKYHNVTYLFDRGMQKTLDTPYTFEKKLCYAVQSAYTGPGCSQLLNSTVNSTPVFESPDPQMASAVKVQCDRCPAICSRNPPNGIQCGECSCPSNIGFCETQNERVNLTGTLAYCADELLHPQKDEKAACSNGFECKTNECRNSACYDRRHDIVQVILDWLESLFRFGK